MDQLFFPQLTRRDNYTVKTDGSYYVYSHYYLEIEVDCSHRCVYCDSHKNELGGDNLQLDHFKPQKRFPELTNDPNNLVLACSKCNRLKSNIWPDKEDLYFINPFEHNRFDYFQVEKDGNLTFRQISGEFQIKLLHLNRISRKNLRRKRIIHHEAIGMQERITQRLSTLYEDIKSNSISKSEVLSKLTVLINLSNEIQKLLNTIYDTHS